MPLITFNAKLELEQGSIVAPFRGQKSDELQAASKHSLENPFIKF